MPKLVNHPLCVVAIVWRVCYSSVFWPVATFKLNCTPRRVKKVTALPQPFVEQPDDATNPMVDGTFQYIQAT
ncbi:hypothetical protein Y032_0828g2561 [Ancylostoma ceylanicum]|uniref:Uncharacterized protein n=1 Tax=Ancylostoma ceylanicum TaxID=53326 RepID=A0A016WBY0_9BILA|nr:hypothetical protein Y032_0828g2561 [Ancylostoma ceylanicum]